MRSILFLFFVFVVSVINAQNTQLSPIKKNMKFLGKSKSLRAKKLIEPGKLNPQKPEHDKKTFIFNGFSFTEQKSIQREFGEEQLITLIENFEGLESVNMPNPDTEGDVGPDYYFQMVKRSFAVWDKKGNLLYGPADNQTIWSDFPGPWDDMGWTDPIVIYDHLADRWLVSNMVYEIGVEYYEMIAVSAGPDPLGEYYCYALAFDAMPDYPKFGLWPDAYYLSVNEWSFDKKSVEFTGASVLAFNREEMLAGNDDPAVFYFHFNAPNNSTTTDIASFLPADLDGPVPPEGTPNYFICMKDDAWGYPEDRLWIWKCEIDWNDTANSSFTDFEVLEVDPFNSHQQDHIFIHQPDPGVKLHSLTHFLMYRLQYRNFGGYQTLVCNHTVEVDGDEHGGVRWYELRDEGMGWEIRQHGTYAPDQDSRWMGSIALDGDGNMALGYSVSSDATYPSIRISGQQYNDSLNYLSFQETSIMEGTAPQIVQGRWGDYSTMSVDPLDNLTFWYTQEYIESSGSLVWQTRIASFQLHKNLTILPDSLFFLTRDDCILGKQLVLKNNSQYEVEIQGIQQTGSIGNTYWEADLANYSFPYHLSVGNSIAFNVYIAIPLLPHESGFYFDSIGIVTDYKSQYGMICLDKSVVTKTGHNKPELGIKVFPNPFSSSTEILILPIKNIRLTIDVFNSKLSRIITLLDNEIVNKGNHVITWDGRNESGGKLLPGIYYLRFINRKDKVLRKVVIY